MREAAHGLARRGWDVEVLTTCARDHYTWRNEYEPGTTTVDDGVVVHRFPVVGSKPTRSRDAHRGAHPVGRRGPARRPARLARRPVPRPRPVPPPRGELRSLRRGDPVAVPLLDDGHRRDGRARAHDRDAVPARRAVRAARGAQPRALRRRAPVVPVRARAPARARARDAPRPRRHRRGRARARRATTPRASSRGTASTRPFLLFAGRRERRQGLGLAARRVPLRDPPVRPAVRPRDHRCQPGRHARRSLRAASTTSGSSTTPRSRTPSRPRPRTCSRAPTRASRARSWSRGWPARPCSPPPAATCCAGTAIARAAASPSPTSSSSRSASRSSPRAPDDAARLAKAGREYVLANYRWERRARRDGSEPGGAAVRVLVVGSYPAARARRVATGRSRPCTASARRATTSTCSRVAGRPRSCAGRSPGPPARCSRGGAAAATTPWSCRSRAAHRSASRTDAAARIDRLVDCFCWGLALRAVRARHDGRPRHRRDPAVRRRAQRPLPLDRRRPPPRHERTGPAPARRRGRRDRGPGRASRRSRPRRARPATTAGAT